MKFTISRLRLILKNSSRSTIILISLICLYMFLLFYKLEQVPTFWFDEGWISSVARNWFELGHYGQLLNAEEIPAGMLNVGFPVIIPIAWSYRIFGIGIWQSRLIIAIYSIGAFALLYIIAKNIFDKKIAIATIFFAIFPIIPWINPVEYSRQVLGEIPAAFYFLAGLATILAYYRKSIIGMPLLILFWSLGMLTKSQIIPMVIMSGLLSSIIFIKKRKFYSALYIIICCTAAVFITYLIMRIFPLLGNDLPLAVTLDLLRSTAFVLIPQVRFYALAIVILFILPALIGTIYALIDYAKGGWVNVESTEREVVYVILLTFTGSWLLWFVLFSNSWLRYLVIPGFLGSMFVTYLLEKRYKLVSILEKSADSLQYNTIFNEKPRMIFLFFILVFALCGNFGRWYTLYTRSYNETIKETATLISTDTDENSVIETFEMELFLFLNRKYQYPSQYNTSLERNTNNDTIYDPFINKPDFIIIGEYGRDFGYYKEVSNSDNYALVMSNNLYDIYKRIK